jgi:hypothetical protein
VGVAAFASRAAIRSSRAEAKPRLRAVSIARAVRAVVSEARAEAMLLLTSDMVIPFWGMGGLAPSRVWLKADGDLTTGEGFCDRVLKDMIKLAVKDLADPVLKVLAAVLVFLEPGHLVFEPVDVAVSDPET